MEPEIHFTYGPACSADEVLASLFASPASACRINLSHVNPDALPTLFERLRSHKGSNRIGADIRGRKLRVGPLPAGEITLSVGQEFELFPVGVDEEELGGPARASVNCPSLCAWIAPGDEVLLDDGALLLAVDRVEETVHCRVQVGGPLPERSGFNVPGRPIVMPSLTQKDRVDLEVLADLQPDFVYLSYVEEDADLFQLRDLLHARGMYIPIVAKIERAVAVERIDSIAEAADVLCIARGDLGVEVELATLPLVQRRIVAAAKRANKPVLLAGEVLWSLTQRPVPTRGELTDVVIAAEQGCAGFVLSDETAVGCDPAGAVRWLHRIATQSISTA